MTPEQLAVTIGIIVFFTAVAIVGVMAKNEKSPEKVVDEIFYGEKEDEVEAPEDTIISVEFSAKEAISRIKESSVENLAGFITDEETRKTVLKAWNKKIGK